MSRDVKAKLRAMTLEWNCPEGHPNYAEITHWQPKVYVLTCPTCQHKQEFHFKLLKSGEPWVEWIIA